MFRVEMWNGQNGEHAGLFEWETGECWLLKQLCVWLPVQLGPILFFFFKSQLVPSGGQMPGSRVSGTRP